jgi:hypothetical protein
MFALLLGIAATAGWIAFDVVVSVVTYPLMPSKEWWALVLSGGVLVGLTVATEILNYIAHQKDERRHSDEHAVIATGTLAIFERLRDVTQTTDQPATRTIEIATERIGRLEARIAKSEAIFWGALTDQDKVQLATALAALGVHSVSVTAHENTDCVELARDLKDCFRRAGWEVARIPLTGTWMSAGASGFSFTTKASQGQLQRPLLQALVGVVRGPVSGIGSHPLPDEDEAKGPDISILVGPKRIRTDDD